MLWSVLLEGEAADASGGGTFFGTICQNAADFMKALGSYIILGLGIILIIMAIYHIVKGFVVTRANWAITIGCLLFGGILITCGWNIVTGDPFGAIGKSTLDEMMDGGPTAIGEFNGGSSGGTEEGTEGGTEEGGGTGGSASVGKARAGLGVLSDGFMVPLGSAVVISVGVMLVIIAVYQVGKYFLSGGRGQLVIPKLIIMAVLGSCMFAATPTGNDEGWIWIRDVLSAITKDTVVAIADGTADTSPAEDDLSGGGFGNDGSGGSSGDVLPGADPSDVPT